MSRILLFLCLWPVALWADSSVLPLRPAFNAEQRSWLQAHDELRVGLIMQAPWAQFDRRQQRLSGANVELMSRLLQGMGVKPQWLRFTDQDELEAALQRGEVDVVVLSASPRHLYQPGLLHLALGQTTVDALYRDQRTLLDPRIALLIERRYERGLLRELPWVIWYPLAFWLLGALTALAGFMKAIVHQRRGRATWVSPDRGVRAFVKH